MSATPVLVAMVRASTSVKPMHARIARDGLASTTRPGNRRWRTGAWRGFATSTRPRLPSSAQETRKQSGTGSTGKLAIMRNRQGSRRRRPRTSKARLGQSPIRRPAGEHATSWMRCAATTGSVRKPWRAWRANGSKVRVGRNVKSTGDWRRRKGALQESSAIPVASMSRPKPRAMGFKRLRILPKQTSKRPGPGRPTLAAGRRAPARSTTLSHPAHEAEVRRPAARTTVLIRHPQAPEADLEHAASAPGAIGAARQRLASVRPRGPASQVQLGWEGYRWENTRRP